MRPRGVKGVKAKNAGSAGLPDEVSGVSNDGRSWERRLTAKPRLKKASLIREISLFAGHPVPLKNKPEFLFGCHPSVMF